MYSNQAPRVSAGKMILGIVLALVVGALLPVFTVLELVLLCPVVLLGGVFMVYLQCNFGWIPAGLFAAAGLSSTAYFMGAQMMWMVMVSSMLPAALMLRGIAQKRPFFEQMRTAVILFVLGIVAALAIAYSAFGGGLIARFMDALRAQFALMPDAAFAPFVEALNSMLQTSGIQDAAQMSVELYRSQIDGVLDLMQQTYAQSLPGTLLSGAVLSGVLASLWGNWMWARRGLASSESYVGVSQWHLPGRISLGLLVLWVASYAMAAGSYATGETVYMTVYQLVGVVFGIQGLAALDRYLLRRGASTGRRRRLLILVVVLCAILRLPGYVLFIEGILSALFGSRGAIRLWAQKKQKEHSDHNDPDQ